MAIMHFTRSGDPFASLVRVKVIEQFLRYRGALTRRQARRILDRDTGLGALTDLECRAVLDRFPNVEGHGWWPEKDPDGRGIIWRCTCDRIVRQPEGTPVPVEALRGGDH
jgi:hypothetical protein